jgi:hypothetical protein
MDVSINASIRQGDLSITLTVKVMQLPFTNSGGGQQDYEDREIVGTITSIDQTGHSFWNARILLHPSARVAKRSLASAVRAVSRTSRACKWDKL